MTTAPEVSLVVDACHLEGRHERLDALVAQLEMCEKALQVNETLLPSFLADVPISIYLGMGLFLM